MSICKLRITAPGKTLSIDMQPDEAEVWFSRIANAFLGMGTVAPEGEIPMENGDIKPDTLHRTEIAPDNPQSISPDVELSAPEVQSVQTEVRQEKESVKTVRGFLRIKCSVCGEIKNFCSKGPISWYICNDCKNRTDLVGLHDVDAKCSVCGIKWKYKTNVDKKYDEFPCLNCGAPITMERNKNGDYETIEKY